MYIRKMGASITKSYSSLDIYELFNKLDFNESLGIFNRDNKECSVLNEYKDLNHFKMYTIANEPLTLEDTVPGLEYRAVIKLNGQKNPRECLCSYEMLHSFNNPSNIMYIRRALPLPVVFHKRAIVVDISEYYIELSSILRIWPTRYSDGCIAMTVPYSYLTGEEEGERFDLTGTFDTLCRCISRDASVEWQKIMEEQLPKAMDLI